MGIRARRAADLDDLVRANTRPGAGREERAVYPLILDAATDPRRALAREELARVLRHVADAGFDPRARERVRGTIRPHFVERGDALLPPRRGGPAMAGGDRPAGVRRQSPPAGGRPAERRAGRALPGRLAVDGRAAGARAARAAQARLVARRRPAGDRALDDRPPVDRGLAALGRPGREDTRWLRRPGRR